MKNIYESDLPEGTVSLLDRFTDIESYSTRATFVIPSEMIEDVIADFEADSDFQEFEEDDEEIIVALIRLMENEVRPNNLKNLTIFKGQAPIFDLQSAVDSLAESQKSTSPKMG